MEEGYFLDILAAQTPLAPPEVLDWYRFYQLAKKHCLIPTLRPLLEGCNLPEQLDSLLEQTSRTVTIQNFSHKSSLCSILRSLTAHGITCYPYKGPFLAELTDRLSERIFGDLDILVPEERVEEAIAVMGSLGYQPVFPKQTLKPFLHFHYEYRLQHSPSRLVVEIKWRVAPDRFGAWGSAFEGWLNETPIAYPQSLVCGPSTEELFVILAVHGAKHLWSRIQWLCDLKELLRLDLQWENVLEHARFRQAERALRLAVHLLELHFGVEVPRGSTYSQFEREHLNPIANRIVEHWFVEEEMSRLERLKTQATLIDNRTARWRFWISTLLKPTPAEILAVSRPLPHHYLYYFVRPLRYLFKLIGLDYLQDPRSNNP